MFWHNFKYSFKILFKNKMLIFWTFVFPILLGLFFNLAFKDIEKNEKLDIINIAIVNNEYFDNNQLLKETFKTLSDDKNENRLFSTKYVKEESEAKELLNSNDIAGYILFNNDEPAIVVKQSNIDATILKYVMDEIIETNKIIEDIIEIEITKIPVDSINDINNFYENIYLEVLNMKNNDNVGINDISGNNLSYTMIEYYTLIAMACLYGGILGLVVINLSLPNMSYKGKRVAITPIGKGKIILSGILASYITQLIGLSILLLFLYFIIKVDFGNNLFFVILLSLIGSLAGLSLGTTIGSVLKTNDNTKTGILLSITMLGCFLSGMMGITMKYIVDKNIPILNRINPASMITDGFYSLYYYDTLDRYLFNIISLIIFSFILFFISFIVLRRQKYDNI